MAVEEGCIPFFNDMNKYKMAWDMFILALAVLTSFACGFEFVLLSMD
jgi:uncharacterized protein (DUF58 family)